MTPPVAPAAAAPRRVLLVVASPARDLEGLALVAYHLRRLGCEARLCDGDDLERRILAHAPDVVTLDQLGLPTRVAAARRARAIGARVVMLPTAGVFQDAAAELWRAGASSGGREVVDRYLAWGDDARRVLLDHGAFAPGQLRVVGCPRFDLYQPPYRQLCGTRAELLDRLGPPRPGAPPPDAPLVVWTTNTFFRRSEELRRSAAAGAVPDHVRREVADEETSFRDLSQAALDVARRHPEWNVLVKVHPLELRQPYDELAASHPNLRVADQLPIRDVLCHADVLLQRFSTTATEAWMAGRPVIEVAVGACHATERPDYLAGCDVVTDLAQVTPLVERYVAGAPIPETQRRAREAFLTAVYHHMDGRAAERCAAAIAELVADPAYPDAAQARTRATAAAELARWRAREDARPANRLKDLLGIPRDASLRVWRRAARRASPPSDSFDTTVARALARFDQAWAGRDDRPPVVAPPADVALPVSDVRRAAATPTRTPPR